MSFWTYYSHVFNLSGEEYVKPNFTKKVGLLTSLVYVTETVEELPPRLKSSLELNQNKSGKPKQLGDTLAASQKGNSIFSRSPKLRRAFSMEHRKSATSPVPEFGVAVIGCGIAGKVRIRDLTTNPDMPELHSVKLRGFVTRQDLTLVGADKLSLSEVVARSDVNAVLVCTENGRHETLARQCLEAGKHVLVEYPLAISFKAAEELYALAKDKGLVLYEEDISLLTNAYDVAKQTVMSKELESAELIFTASYGHEWTDKWDESGSLLISSMNNMHWLVDLFGDLTPVSCTLSKEGGIHTMTACMETDKKRPVTLTITRCHGQQTRARKINFRFTDGSKLDELPPLARSTSGPGLFLRDFFQFHQACIGQFDLTVWTRRSLDSLKLADQLNEMAGL